MKITRIIFNLTLMAGVFALFNSCTDNNTDVQEDIMYTDGVLIANQGGFGHGNASVSYYDYGKDKVYNKIFEQANGEGPGDVVQSITVSGDEALIVVNNSNKIEVVRKETMERLKTIEIEQPRYIAINNNKAYISSWTIGGLAIMDMSTRQITDTILTDGSGPEKMLIAGDYLYVTNKGGFGADSTVAVINLSTDELEKTIQVGYQPSDMVKAADGNIWVLCSGQQIWDSNWVVIGHKPCKLYMIDTELQRAVKSGELFDDQHPEHLEIDNDGKTMYMGGGFGGFEGVWKITIEGNNIAVTEITSDVAYAVNYDKNTDKLFVSVASFTSNSTLKRYETDGTLRGEYEIGVGGGEMQLRNNNQLH